MTSNSSPTYSIFVSYSRKDKEIVAPLASLMRIGGMQVFRDSDSIAPGKRWSLVIADSITEARTFVVFWSSNASNSSEVKSEISCAIMKGKDVVPVLLDDTPLCGDLAPYQWLDFRPFILSATRQYKRKVSLMVGRGDPSISFPPNGPRKIPFYTIGMLTTYSVSGIAASVAAGATVGSFIPGAGTVLGAVIAGVGAISACMTVSQVVRKLNAEIQRMTDAEKREIASTVFNCISLEKQSPPP